MRMNERALEAVVIGGGPAGLMAAEVLSAAGAQVDVYDSMPSLGRKFLMAGKGGLNLTHSEAREPFFTRYGARQASIEPLLHAFDSSALREWVRGLGVETFVGSSGRVFPTGMKAAPLLRKWLHRLREAGVKFHVRHRWLGWNDRGALRFATPQGEHSVRADVVVLALGGGSWMRLGSDAAWVPMLEQRGVQITPLQPSNCGFDIGWSEHFRSRFAGQPLKSVVASFTDSAGVAHRRQGECIITDTGIEGGLVYAHSASLRDEIAAKGAAVVHLDLLPGREPRRVIEEIAHPRGAKSLSTHLQSRLGIKGVKAGLLREALPKQDFADPVRLAAALKALPLRLVATRPIDEAISTAGGVAFEALDERLMLRAVPGVFCAGEMLDWEAPTGGYLLTACFGSGHAAGAGALAWLDSQTRQRANFPMST
ncbi:MAG: TIGR03862 family flavoprotein [Betaproteobacteria bacterium]|nr:TIGR03862 family flavoprotein [Betaproteobacteria bacterium]